MPNKSVKIIASYRQLLFLHRALYAIKQKELTLMKQIRDSKIIAGGISIILTVFAIIHSKKLVPEFEKISSSLIVSILIGSIIFLIFYLERKKNNSVVDALKNTIVYQIAFILSLFGWLKIFKLHLNTSIVYLDMPIGELSGYELSTMFYGYSYSFILFIGSLQLIGSILILFKRTRLLGVLILSPILANIIVTNITYSIGMGVTLMAAFLLLGCIFIVLEEYEKIKELIFPTKSNKEVSNNKFNYIVITLIVIIPFLLGFFNYSPHTNSEIIGKYLVKNYSINGIKINFKNSTDTILTSIYFDENQDCIFRYGNSFETLKVGKLRCNKGEKKIKVIWRYPKNYSDTLKANFEKVTKLNEYQIKGTLGADNIEINLLKK